jgi:ABC-type transport system involved in cytochrome bd biosynthesis fused ATPase/permease subunit
MIKRRLLSLVKGAVPLIVQGVALQWMSLVASVIMVASLGSFLERLFSVGFSPFRLAIVVGVCVASACVRYAATLRMGVSSHRLAFVAKRSLRDALYAKLAALGPSYTRSVSTAEVIQLAAEGIEQLEVYFSKYLPQLIYCVLAPLTLFAVLAFVDIRAACVLLACVPLIPVSIMVVQRRARAVFARYWDNYVDLGSGFLEGLTSLVTLKSYQADEAYQRRMEADAESFRKATMRLLRLQLSSVTIMDAIAYGGAAAGIICAVLGFGAGTVSLAGCFTVVVLSAEFFIPVRQLGALFHVAMNGMSASDRIFKLLDLDEPVYGAKADALLRPVPSGEGTSASLGIGGVDPRPAPATTEVAPPAPATTEGTPAAPALRPPALRAAGLGFSYDGDTAVLSGVDLEVVCGAPVALVGASGSGKSTLAALIGGRRVGYEGSLCLGDQGGRELSCLSRAELMRAVVVVGDRSHIFKGTVRENLLLASPGSSDEALWQALEKVALDEALRRRGGLDASISEGASDLSGGQRQRLALARALLSDADVYVFDEATSNVDPESEAHIMAAITALAQTKPVLVISHRLAAIRDATCIYVLEGGRICERGSHEALLKSGGVYAKLYEAQRLCEEFFSSVPAERATRTKAAVSLPAKKPAKAVPAEVPAEVPAKELCHV